MVTESWLALSTTNGLLDPENRFSIFRYDKPLQGVCVFVKRNLGVINIEIVRNDNNAHIETEIVYIDIIISKGKYRLITVYRPPGCITDCIHYNTVLIADLELLFDVSYPVILSGDLNCADVNWINNTSPTDGVQDIILDFFISRECGQFVRAPTRLGNILDVVLTDSPILIDSLKVISPFGNSDHCMVRFNVSVNCEESCEPSPDDLRYLWREADYTVVANYSNTVNWFNMLTTILTPDSFGRAFTLNSAIKNYVPSIPVHNKQSRRTQK